MVYYAAFYTRPEDRSRRQNLAGVEKANYILKKFKELGNEVTILSNAKMLSKKRAKTECMFLRSENIMLHTFASWGKGRRIKDLTNAIYGLLQLFVFLLFHLKEEDVVCVYHSMGYRGVFALVRKFRKFKYILEVEELFQYFEANTSGYKKKEKRVFREPDAFIFSNKLIADEVNPEGKPFVIVNGVYENERRIAGRPAKGDKTIRLVYAGSLEPQKGVEKILDIARDLNERFEVRIIGFGCEKDTKKVIDRVSELKKNGKKVMYDGIKTGQEYKDYLQQCDIGLCIQDREDIFNQYEFPSKVISYIANGLNVISNDLIQLRTSEIADYLNIVESNDTSEIASYINSEKYRCFDARETLERLDKNLFDSMKKLVLEM